MRIIIVAGLLLFTLLMTTSCADPDSDPAVIRAKQHTQEVFGNAMADYAKKEKERELDYVAARFGEDASHLFYRCTSGEPPALKQNQDRCAKLLARVKAAHEADAAAEARQKQNW